MTETEEIDAILELFTSDGWRFMLSDIEKHYDAINKIDGVTTEQQLFELTGEIRALKWIMNSKDWYQNARDNLTPYREG